MKNKKIQTLVLTALLAALTCVATMVIQIPSPTGGFFNLGDCVVLLSAFLLGPIYGMAAAGIGSAFADILSGYFIYAPGTLVIKGLMALAAALIYRSFTKRRSGFGSALAGAVVGGIAAELIMVAGYFLYELPMYGFGACLTSALTTNLPQAGVGLVAGVCLYTLLDRSKVTGKIAGGVA